MKKFFISLAASFSIGLLSACSVHHGNFTVLSSNLINLDKVDIENTTKIRNVKGESTCHIIVFVPYGETNPNPESALRDVFVKTNTDLLTNARMDTFTIYVPYIYGRTTFSVTGDAIKTVNGQ